MNKKQTEPKTKTPRPKRQAPSPTRKIRFSAEAQIETTKPFEELSKRELVKAMREWLRRVEKGTAIENFKFVGQMGMRVLRDKKGETVALAYYKPEGIPTGQGISLDLASPPSKRIHKRMAYDNGNFILEDV